MSDHEEIVTEGLEKLNVDAESKSNKKASTKTPIKELEEELANEKARNATLVGKQSTSDDKPRLYE